MLFALFVNDLEFSLLNNDCNHVKFDLENVDNMLRLVVLMYADDTVILANNPQKLKCAIKALESYCEEWQICVNCSKTKIVVFGERKTQERCSYELFGEVIEKLDCYTYLGIVFHRRGGFKKSQEVLTKQAYRAMYSLISKGRKLQLPFDLMTELFYSLVVPIIIYGSEIWGYSMIKDIEKLQLKFMKMILNVKASTCSAVVYGETGIYPIYICIYKRMISFWCKVLNGDSSKLSYILYDCMVKLYNDDIYEWPWLHTIKRILDDCGVSYVWCNQENINVNWLKLKIERTLKDQWIQKWQGDVEQMSSCALYKMYKTVYTCEKYLLSDNDNRSYLVKFRTANNKLPIVVGRYSSTPREERKCTLCHLNKIGDEYHFLLECNNERLQDYRELYIPFYYRNRPTMQKFLDLMCTENLTLLKNVSVYLKRSFALL